MVSPRRSGAVLVLVMVTALAVGATGPRAQQAAGATTPRAQEAVGATGPTVQHQAGDAEGPDGSVPAWHQAATPDAEGPDGSVPAWHQAATPDAERLAGPDRFETAAAVSRSFAGPGAAEVYVATGADFPDALAAGAVAGRERAPVLLVTRDEIPHATRTELERLQPRRIVVLGGRAAISDAVVAELHRFAAEDVARVAGSDRYGTAAALSARAFSPGAQTALVATGEGFADALAGGAAAVVWQGPVLLVTRESIPSATADELRRLQPGSIRVLGGDLAVSAAVEAELGDYTTGSVTRLAGADRFATSAEISRMTLTAPQPVVYLATGLGFADALAGSPVAGAAGAPVLLVQRRCVTSAVLDEIARLRPDRLVLLGGTAAIEDFVGRLTPCGRRVETIATQLQAPWDVAFVPDGRAFVSERDSGRLLVRHPDGRFEPVRTFAVNSQGEGGFMGLAASPTFPQDGLLYAYYTTAIDNRVVRFTLNGAEQPILTGIPRASNHNGGRIRFGPDGLLYVSTGDAAQSSRSQDPDSLAGKILRVHPDGTVPPDNPRAGSPAYALGIRNAQGLAWDRSGRLYASEFGPERDDEINHIVPDGNYGWPQVTGAAGDPRFVDPIVVRQPPVASWSGVEVLVDGAIPDWEGSLFAAGLRGGRLWRFALDGNRVVGAEELFVGEHGRLRAVVQAPDGSLWVLTNNRDGRGQPRPDDDRIIRIIGGDG